MRMMLFFHAVAREQLEVISLGSWVVGVCRVSGQQRRAPHIFPAAGDQQIPPRDARWVPCAFTVLLLCKTTSPAHLSQSSSTCFLALSLAWVHPWASHSSPSQSQHHGHCQGPARHGCSPLNVLPVCNPGLFPKRRDLSQSAGSGTAVTPQPSRAPSRCRKPVHCALGRGTGGWQHLAARLDLSQPNSPVVVIAACCALRKPGTALEKSSWRGEAVGRQRDLQARGQTPGHPKVAVPG